MKNERAFIYDRTVLTPFGIGLNTNINSILENKSAIKALDRTVVEQDYPIKYCGEIDWAGLGFSQDKDSFKSLFSIRTIFDQLPILRRLEKIDQVFCLVRSFSYTDIEKMYLKDGGQELALQNPKFVYDELTARGIKIDEKDIVYLDNSCTSGNCVLGFSKQGIELGLWESCLVLTVDLLDQYSLLVLNGLGALNNTEQNPETASRPFDLRRKGFVKSDGAAAAIVCTKRFAERNHLSECPIEIVSFTQSADAYRLTDGRDDVAAVTYAMTEALIRARLNVEDISFIKAHGTATKLNDEHEAKAIEKVFFENNRTVPILALKGHLGHVTDASGLVEALIAAEAAIQGFVLQTKNCDDPEYDLNILKQPKVICGKNYFMCNTIGFGGNNSSLILSVCCQNYEGKNI